MHFGNLPGFVPKLAFGVPAGKGFRSQCGVLEQGRWCVFVRLYLGALWAVADGSGSSRNPGCGGRGLSWVEAAR